MSLRELAAAHGRTLDQLAGAVGVDALLFLRVDAGRQGLPRSVAGRVAGVLGVGLGDVLGAAGLVTEVEGPRAEVPLPLDVLRYGDPYIVKTLGRTVEPRPSASASAVVAPQLWMTTSGSLRRYDRTSGALIQEVSFIQPNAAPRWIAQVGSRLVMVASQGVINDDVYSAAYAYGVDTGSGPATMAYEFADGSLVASSAGVYEPAGGYVWVTFGNFDSLGRMNPATGAVPGFMFLGGYIPTCLVLHDGFLYVASYLESDSLQGAVVRIDPATNTVTLSTGAMPVGGAIAFDDDGLGWVVTSTGLYTLNPSTMVVSAQTVTGGTIDGAWNASWSHGHLWVSASAGGGIGSGLYKLDGTAVVASRAFSPSGPFMGMVVPDGDVLWAIDPAANQIHKLDPDNFSTSLLTITVGPTGPFVDANVFAVAIVA